MCVRGMVRNGVPSVWCRADQLNGTYDGDDKETVLEIEYVESILPPKYLSSFEQEDWISDIDLSQKGYVLRLQAISTVP